MTRSSSSHVDAWLSRNFGRVKINVATNEIGHVESASLSGKDTLVVQVALRKKDGSVCECILDFLRDPSPDQLTEFLSGFQPPAPIKDPRALDDASIRELIMANEAAIDTLKEENERLALFIKDRALRPKAAPTGAPYDRDDLKKNILKCVQVLKTAELRREDLFAAIEVAAAHEDRRRD